VITLLAIDSADRYVGGAYLVFLLLLTRIQRELGSLAELAERSRSSEADHDVGQVHGREQEIESVREEAQREEAAR
jgi:hypothetical protein